MNIITDNKEYFPRLGKIEYAGPESRNPLSYRYYDENRIVMGKPLKDHLRFAMAYWHTLCAAGGDPFGAGTRPLPWNEGSTAMDRARKKWMRPLSS